MSVLGNGTFYDGTAPLPLPATATLLGNAVNIRTPGGAHLATWSLAEIDIVDRRTGNLTLARRGGEARLKVADPVLGPRLVAALGPGLRRRARRSALGWVGAGAALVGAVALLLVFAWPTAADLLARRLPDPWLDRIGQSTAAAFVGGEATCTDARAVTLLDGLARRISDASGRPKPEITVIRNPISNAFAVPSNRVIIFSGLISEAQHPNEVAGVLAHEIGHLERRHPARQLVRQGGLFLLVELFTGGSSFGAFGALAVSTGYSREFEREADSFAREALARAKLDARPVAGFFTRMAEKEKKASSRFGIGVDLDYLSTHPNSAERAEAFAQAAAGRTALTGADFAALKKICGE